MKRLCAAFVRVARTYGTRRSLAVALGLGLVASGALTAISLAPGQAMAQEETPPIRELYIPFEELDVILEGDPNRVFLDRDEYEELVERARVRPVESAPRSLAVSAGAYEIGLEEGSAVIKGTLDLEVLEDGLLLQHPLEFSGVGLRKVLLNGEPAALTRNESGMPLLLVKGKGRYRLSYEGAIAPESSAAQQSLRFRVPDSAVLTSGLSVVGDVELRSGAAVRKREVAADGSRTTFDLMVMRGEQHWVVSANQRKRGSDSRWIVRSVLIDEVTQNYERLHATISVLPLSGAIERLQFTIPNGFEVLKADAPQVARWEQAEDPKWGRILVVTMTEPLEERWVLPITMQASRAKVPESSEPPDLWSFPRLDAIDAIAQGSIVSLWVDERLIPTDGQLQNLLPIDSAAVEKALPASLLELEPGAPRLRQTMSYYAPTGSFVWESRLREAPVSLKSSVGAILSIGDRDLQLQGALTLRSEGETRWEWIWDLPAGWSLDSLAESQGRALTWERMGRREDGGETLRIRDVSGLKSGEPTIYDFRLTSTPEGWLEAWEQKQINVPEIQIRDAELERGAIGILVRDDLDLTPISIGDSVPLLEGEKAAVGLGGLDTRLAYRYSGKSSLVLEASRTMPRVTAERFSLLDVSVGQVMLRHELHYRVERAAARELEFSLPDTTPTEITIVGGEGVVINDVTRREAEGRRYWKVNLATPALGKTVLKVEFAVPWGFAAEGSFVVPDLQIEGVELQVGAIGIEGTSEFELDVQTDLRRVDDGELAASGLPTSRRLVGVFGQVGKESEIELRARRRQGLGLPAALISKGSLVTQLDVAGTALTSASYDISTLGTLLEVTLPEGSELWTATYNGTALKPQRDGGRLLLGLPAEGIGRQGNLTLVYETPIARWERWGQVGLQGPSLGVVMEAGGVATEIPQADLEWRVVAPAGYVLQERGGTLRKEGARRALSGPELLLGAIGGMFQPWHLGLPLSSARKTFYGAVDQALPAAAMRGAELSDLPKTEPASGEFFGRPADALAAPAAPTAGREWDAEVPRSEALDETTQLDVFAGGETREPAMAEESRRDDPGRPNGAADDKAKEEADFLASDLSPATTTVAPLERLEGVRGLPIALLDADGPVFRGLGESPSLKLDVVSRQATWMAGWLVALSVFAVGLGLRRFGRRVRVYWIGAAMILGALPPCLSARLDVVMPVFAGLFLAAWGLIAWEAFAAWCWNPVCRVVACCCGGAAVAVGSKTLRDPKRSATLLLALVLCAVANSLGAQEDGGEALRDRDQISIEALRRLLIDGEGRVSIPDDVVIVPYDPERPESLREASRVVVPYARYVEWWNRAYPERPLNVETVPFEAVLSSASYRATLDESQDLQLEGVLALEVLKEGPVAVRLPLSGGSMEEALLDGRPARLQTLDAAIAAATGLQQGIDLGGEGVLLQLEGKGRHELRVRMRFQVTRQGGWRQVAGRIPVGVASDLTVLIPAVGTELRVAGAFDRGSWESKVEREQFTVALPTDGNLKLDWRSGLGSQEVDRALTVVSAATLDVREDGLQCVWGVGASFSGGVRESFTLSAPRDWQVEAVTGEAVRAFDVREEGERQRIEVVLVEPAEGTAEFQVRLTRRATAWGEAYEFEAPYLQIRDAALESGEISVRRGARVSLRTLIDDGVTRTSAGEATLTTTRMADEFDPSVLKLNPFQAFRFVKPPYVLRLEVAPVKAQLRAEWKAVLRADRRETAVDASVKFAPGGAAVHRVELSWPSSYRLERLTPAGLEWSTIEEGDRRRLVVNWLDGREAPFELALFLIADAEAVPPGSERIAIPKLVVHDVQESRGEWAVVVDPDRDVRFEKLVGCAPRGVGTIDWLRQEQISLARAGLTVENEDYAAEAVLTARVPQVTGRSITNVRLTSRAIEETTLVEWRIAQAGVRELKLLLPEGWQDARVDAKLLRRKLIGPALQEDGSERPGWIEMRLELQDAVRGEYSVLLERDRPLAEDLGRIELVELGAGRTERRLLAIENVGRDELLVPEDSVRGLVEVERQQAVWQSAVAILGDSIARLFQAREGEAAGLNLATLERREVERKGARIGLAVTTLVVDDWGAYRAEVEYRVANSSEPVLEIELPEGARLWTAIVADEPVKVSRPDDGSERVVRLPLVKTADGEGDYGVTIQYGGRIELNDLAGQVRFPLIGRTNLAVELSQVRLYLPENRRWFDFDGTMGLVADEKVLAAGFQGYLLKRIQDAQQSLESVGSYSAVRAKINLQQSRELLARNSSENDGLAMNNSVLLGEAERQVEAKLAESLVEGVDNRTRLNARFDQQSVERSSNVISELGLNFDDAAGGVATGDGGVEFNEGWIAGNQFDVAGKPAEGQAQSIGRFYRGRSTETATEEETLKQTNDRARGQFESFSRSNQLQGQLQMLPAQPESDSERDRLERYEQRLFQQNSLSTREQAPAEMAEAEPTAPSGGGGRPMSMGGAGLAPQPVMGTGGGAIVSEPVDTGWRSLSLELPRRGTLYRFSTPRGETEIVARSVPRGTVERGTILAVLVFTGLLLMAIGREVIRYGRVRCLGHAGFAVIAGLAGIASLLVWGVQLAGLLLIGFALVRGLSLFVISLMGKPASSGT